MKTKYWYSTFKNKKGTWRVRHWYDYFTDEGSKETIKVTRQEPIKLNGEPIRFYKNSEVARMTLKERHAILI